MTKKKQENENYNEFSQNLNEQSDIEAENAELVEEEKELATEDAPEMSAEELADLLIKMGKEKEASEERCIRLQADFDNYRKRTAREKEDVIKQANSELFKLLLPIIDNLERAANQPESTPAPAVIEGVKKILKQFTVVMAVNVVEPVEALGKDFDPNIHEAVMQEDAGPENSGKVIEELQRGYTMCGKLLRPSMVKVGK